MDVSVEHLVMIDQVPYTRNRRVKVRMIAQMHFDGGATADEIAEHYGITTADVYAALAYYVDHKPSFDERDRENERLLREHGIDGQAQLARWRAKLQAEQAKLDAEE